MQVVFLSLRGTQQWAAMPASERQRLLEAVLPVAPSLRVRLFDAEPFSTTASVRIMVEVESLAEYGEWFDVLRTSELVADGYLEPDGTEVTAELTRPATPDVHIPLPRHRADARIPAQAST